LAKPFHLMKKRRLPQKFSLLAAAATLVIAAGIALGQEAKPWSQNESPLPAPTGHVNDYAGAIDAATKQQLETRLRELKAKTGVELAVAVVKTTGDRDIFDYSLAVARGWGIGSKADDNPSALLFIAIDDRKYFTQVSKDLEDELPDGVVGGLQRQYLVPEFKKANYGKGTADTIDAYIKTIENKGNPATNANATVRPAAGPTSSGFPFGSLFCCLIVIVGIIVIIIANRGGSNKGDRGGRGGGGRGGEDNILPAILGGLIGASLGGGSSGGSSSDWGGGGFGGGGGGDFGGFGGGGDFGGGGAGGGW
jgi:uncharacterized protein